MKDIAGKFDLNGELTEYLPFGSGHIHHTYLVKFQQPEGPAAYVFQQINTNVFKSPGRVMENIVRVTSHLKKKMQAEGVSDLNRRVLSIIPTLEGKSYYTSPEGECWRVYRHIFNSVSFDVIDSRKRAFSVSEAFGSFLNYLTDLPADSIHETIPDFHNGPMRFKTFGDALQKDRLNRAFSAREEIGFLQKNSPLFEVFPGLIKSGYLNLSVTHNDTKVNNILFDRDTDQSLCVVDLDTVMPGVLLYDFGDLARTSLSGSPEDERDLSRVRVQLPVFRALVEGFFTALKEKISQTEIAHIVHSTQLMPLIIGMRFLTDYLEGDHYFKTEYPEHNLVRTRAQFQLARSVMENRDQMQKIVDSLL